LFPFALTEGENMKAEWRFKRMQPSDIKQNPVEQEFFRNEESVSAADSLIREALQNSLDARHGNGPVRVRISRGLCEYPKTWLTGLKLHLDAAEVGPSPWSPDEPCGFISIEDFGTRGLMGLVEAGYETDFPADSHQDFYYFWRNVGRSSKRHGERGSWGLGKAVYPKSSAINAFFGLSVPLSGAPSLMGQAVLPVHAVGDGNGGKHPVFPHGYFGRFQTDIDPDFATPLVNSTEISAFCECERSSLPQCSTTTHSPSLLVT
jgi:hypothetical protein